MKKLLLVLLTTLSLQSYSQDGLVRWFVIDSIDSFISIFNAPPGMQHEIGDTIFKNTIITNKIKTTTYYEFRSITGALIVGDILVIKGDKYVLYEYYVDEVIYDVDGNYSTTNDQVKLQGFVSVRPTLYFDANWNGLYNLDYLKVGFQITENSQAQLIGNIELPQNYQKQILLYNRFLPTIQFFIGQVPVVITSTLKIYGGIKANGFVKFNVDYYNNFTMNSYVEKPSGVSLNDFSNWNSVTTKSYTSNIDQNDLIDYTLSFSGELPYINSNIDFYLYNMQNVTTSLRANAAIDVDAYCDVNNGCNFDVDLKLQGCFDLKLKAFNIVFLDNTLCPFNQLYDIWESISSNSQSDCNDPDSPNYNPNGNNLNSCTYAYLTKVEVLEVDTVKADGSYWDNVGSYQNPDVLVKVKNTNNSNCHVEIPQIEDCGANDLPYNYNLNQQIKFTDDTWKLEIVDSDYIFSDQMGITTFNPIDIIRVSNNAQYFDINVNDNKIRFHYVIL